MSDLNTNFLRPLAAWVAALGFLLSIAACAADDVEGNQAQATCEPGTIQTCTCDDGTPGERECMDDETFTACQCPEEANQNQTNQNQTNQNQTNQNQNNQPQTNACGGDDPLLYEGVVSEPGNNCGPCNDGFLECDGEDALTCEGAGELNACGGCALLPVEPGEDCEDGTYWECDGTDAIVCRPCEADEQLVSLNGEEFCAPTCANQSDCDLDQYCDETHNVCLDDDDEIDENACGGSAPLTGEPGDPCGQGTGELTCEGTENLVCGCESDEFYDAQADACRLEDSALCATYCDLIYGCLNECGVGTNQINQLVSNCLDGFDNFDPGCNGTVINDRETIEEFVYGNFDDLESDELSLVPNTCADTRWLRCGNFGIWGDCTPACQAPPTVGDVCTGTDDCTSGDLLAAECLGERDANGDLVDDGICTAYQCFIPDVPVGSINVDSGCGSGNGCYAIQQPDGSTLGICVDLCDDNSDCATGTSCQLMGDLYDADGYTVSPAPIGVGRMCDESCDTDSDCPDTWRCNTSGICEFPCTDSDWSDFCTIDVGSTCVDDNGTEYCELD